jgi:hypothetical protein
MFDLLAVCGLAVLRSNAKNTAFWQYVMLHVKWLEATKNPRSL